MFKVHWSDVPPADAGRLIAPGHQLVAMWPSPVEHDTCFAQAGFTEFGDNDDAWLESADALLGRALSVLSGQGEPILSSRPLVQPRPWYRRLLQRSTPQPLLQQARLPMQWDSLPGFHARFPASGTELRTGDGHFLLWITVPGTVEAAHELVDVIAAPWALHRTRLEWRALLPDGA